MKERKQLSLKAKRVITALVAGAIIALSFTCGYFSKYLIDGKKQTTASELTRLIDQVGYVYDPVTGEERQVTEQDIADALINGLLDDYAEYYDKEQYKAIKEQRKGNNHGVGFSIYKSDCSVYSVVGNSPADLAGIKVGDVILSGVTNENKVPFTCADEVTAFINGYGNDVDFKVEVYREGVGSFIATLRKTNYVRAFVSYFDSEKALVYRTVDGKMQGVEVAGAMDLPKDTAYIKLDNFEGGAFNQMENALTYMKGRGKSKLILDLRDNGGGNMDVLLDIASLFINNGGSRRTLIAYAQGKEKQESFYTPKNNFYDNITAISIIANENSASATECLIGAMLYYGDCFGTNRLIIEKNQNGVAKTYGKGIMQTTYKLISGGAFKLTTAKIYLPDKKNSIHGVGFIATGDNAVESQNALARAIQSLGQEKE